MTPRTLSRLAAVALLAGAPLASANLAVAEPSPDPNLTQTVTADEKVVTGQKVTIDAGHVDMGPKVVNGEWKLMLRDDTATPKVWRDPSDVVLRVKDAALLDAPTGQGYEFLGTKAGTKVHVIPQTQNQNVVWLGWNTQDPAVVKELQRGANLRLLGTSGPGALVMFLQDGAFGGARPLVDSRKPAGQDIWADVNTHVHANWVFTSPGAYAVSLQVRGTTNDNKPRHAQSTLRFAVGDSTTDDAARTAAAPTVDPALTAMTGNESQGAASKAPQEQAAKKDEGTMLPVVVGSAVAGLLVIGGVVAATKRSRRLRDEAESGHDAGRQGGATAAGEGR